MCLARRSAVTESPRPAPFPKIEPWRLFPTTFNEINNLAPTVDQEAGGSSPPSCTKINNLANMALGPNKAVSARCPA
jgi:hypothetical protein